MNNWTRTFILSEISKACAWRHHFPEMKSGANLLLPERESWMEEAGERYMTHGTSYIDQAGGVSWQAVAEEIDEPFVWSPT